MSSMLCQPPFDSNTMHHLSFIKTQDPVLTLELVLVLICAVVLSDQDLCGHVQTDHTGTGHQEEHDKLLAHHPQRFVLPTVNRGWTGQTGS